MTFEKAIDLYQAHRFQESLENFEQCFTESGNQDQILSSYYYAITICKKLENGQKHLQLVEKLILYLAKNKLFRQLNEEIKDIDNIDLLSSVSLDLSWIAAFEVGELEMAYSQALHLLERYYKSKNFSRGLNVINELKKRIKLSDQIVRYAVEFHMMRGDGDSATKELAAAIKKKIVSYEYVNLIIDSIDSKLIARTSFGLHWSVFLSRYNNLQKQYANSVTQKKKKVNVLYQAFLFYPLMPVFISALTDYAITNKKKALYESMKQYVRTQRIEWKENLSLKDHVQKAFDQEFNFDEDVPLPEIADEAVDMATDLFSETSLGQKHEAEQKRKMERAVEFLREIGEESKAINLSQRLEESSDSVTPLIDLTDEQQKSQDIIESLQKSLDAFSLRMKEHSHELAVQDEGSDARMMSYLKKDGVVITESNFKDMTVALMEMGMSSSAMTVLDKISLIGTSGWSLERRIELKYLQIEVLRRLGRIGDALSIVKEMIETWALKEAEQLCFHYLAGEIYRENDILDRALFHYRVAYQMDKNYRMVEERIREIVEA